MANFHARSNSFPSNSHPVVGDVEDQLCRLRSSEATSTSATSMCASLASLRDLHEGINNLIQMPSVQQSLSHENWINELVEGSLRLVDLCEFSRDIVSLTKESVQELESSIRRKRGETATVDDINAYVTSRKMMVKKVNKYIKNLKGKKNSSSLLDNDNDFNAIAKTLKEAEDLGFSVLKTVLKVICEEKGKANQRSWSLLSKFTPTSRVHSEVQQEISSEGFSLTIDKSRKSMDIQEQLKQSEMSIHELEEGLEGFFRSLVKTRATFLNVLSH